MTDFERALEFVGIVEGGYSKDPDDWGNWTGGRPGSGELKGTNHGISAKSYPHLDIVNLTKADAAAIYKRDYWDAINGDNIPYPLNKVAFDHAVNAGVSRALEALDKFTDPVLYIAQRLDDYTTYKTWASHGRGWVRRMTLLLRDVHKETTDKEGQVVTVDTIVLNLGSGVKINNRGTKLDITLE